MTSKTEFARTQIALGIEVVKKARATAAAKVAEATADGTFYNLSSFTVEALVDADADIKAWAPLIAAADQPDWTERVRSLLCVVTGQLVSNGHECRSTSTAARMMGEADRAAAARLHRTLSQVVTLIDTDDDHGPGCDGPYNCTCER